MAKDKNSTLAPIVGVDTPTDLVAEAETSAESLEDKEAATKQVEAEQEAAPKQVEAASNQKKAKTPAEHAEALAKAIEASNEMLRERKKRS